MILGYSLRTMLPLYKLQFQHQNVASPIYARNQTANVHFLAISGLGGLTKGDNCPLFIEESFPNVGFFFIIK